MLPVSTIRTIVGIIGNVISFFLFLSPVPTFRKIIKVKSVQEFKPDPYVATILSCAMWVFYGCLNPDSLLLVTINGTGLVIEGTFILIFVIYSDNKNRKKILMYFAIEALFMAVVVLVTLFAFHTTKLRVMFVGVLSMVFNILMYASPLTVMKMVIKTKSVKYMPFTLSFFSLVNGIVWLTYSLLKFDINILIPNALGTLSGVIQIVLYAWFYKSTKWDDDDDKSSNQVQLSEI